MTIGSMSLGARRSTSTGISYERIPTLRRPSVLSHSTVDASDATPDWRQPGSGLLERPQCQDALDEQ